MRTAFLLYACSVCCALLVTIQPAECRAADPIPEGVSSREARNAAKGVIPFNRLSPQARELVEAVVENPSYFRRMPSQQIACNPEMFTFLVRRPEVMVSIWELMGITQVSTRRTSPNTFLASDGVGTTAKCDLIYGDERIHIYYGTGNYDGSMSPRKMTGRCVCILQSQAGKNDQGDSVVAGTMDVFLKLDNFGADLLTRTLGPLVSKTADYNFVETANFMSQISQVCMYNPAAAQGLAAQLNNIEGPVRQEFAAIAAKIAAEQYPGELDEQTSKYSAADASHPTAQSSSVQQRPIHQRPIQQRAVASRFEMTDEQSIEDVDSAALVLMPSSGSPAPTTTDDSSRVNKLIPQPADIEQPTPMFIAPSTIAPRKTNVYMRR